MNCTEVPTAGDRVTKGEERGRSNGKPLLKNGHTKLGKKDGRTEALLGRMIKLYPWPQFHLRLQAQRLYSTSSMESPRLQPVLLALLGDSVRQWCCLKATSTKVKPWRLGGPDQGGGGV